MSISLLTCTPGRELYSTFGHSALRVTDSVAKTSIIYNYGTFDFNDPDFYKKFIRGKLLYFVSVEEFSNFVYGYNEEKRGITEQVLDLSCKEKKKLVEALQENAKEENRYYKYDFVYDNCTTRLRDIVFKMINRSVTAKNILPQKGITFRNLIHGYLDKSYQYWSKLGIDILLGKPLDKKISNNEAMFLPDYLMKAFDSTIIDGKPFVLGKKVILNPAIEFKNKSWLSPFAVFGILFLVVAALTFSSKAEKILIIFDRILFFLCGALGFLILFMWFGTDHQTCRNNFNLVWAFPIHLIVSFFITKKWKWLKFYFLGNIIVLILMLIFWKWLPQEMNNALLPILSLLLLRSIIRLKKL
jgi:hypothetical protein